MEGQGPSHHVKCSRLDSLRPKHDLEGSADDHVRKALPRKAEFDGEKLNLMEDYEQRKCATSNEQLTKIE
jgi:hypothetical protein